MSYLRRFAYMGLGALLVLALVVGGVVAFAQEDDGQSSADEASERLQDDTAGEAAEDETPAPRPRFPGERLGPHGENERLADTLGITVEALAAAEDAAYAAAIDQALAEGLITEAQAAQLRAGGFGRRFIPGLAVDKEQLLAEALGISVEELEAARAEMRAAELAAMVEAGALTQEEADLIGARAAVRSYVDQEALAETILNAYEAAVAAAVADGAITQAQAEQLLENMSANAFRSDAFGRGFNGGRGPHGGRHQGPGNFFAPNGDTAAPALEGATGA